MRPARRFAMVLALVSLFVTSSLLAPLAPSHAQLEDLIARIKPAVVVVAVKHVLGGSGHGSGFIYDSSGLILTNQHVVEGAVEITVILPDRRSYPATVVDYVRRNEYACPPRVEVWTDAAVLKVNASSLPTLSLGDSETLRQGQEILVLGYPGGLGTEEVSVSRGIVGALRSGWFQTDATIVRGNSGGPVVDRQGRAVGLATFGTADFYRIGGVTAINSVRAMADAGLTPSAARSQEFKVTGLEYVPVFLGRRKLWRNRYDPGATGAQASVRETSAEITQVQNFAGALLFTVRASDGIESKSFLEADGLFSLGSSGGSWNYSYPRQGVRLWDFPPCRGLSWQNRWQAENASDGVRRQAVIDVRIESMNEVVTVPAGTFPQSIRIVEIGQFVDVRGNQTRSWRSIENTWWAPGVGAVRVVWESPDTRERVEQELLSINLTSATLPPRPPGTPTPPPPEAVPPTTPSPPVVGKPAAPNDRLIAPGERIGAARIGDSLDDVIRVFGEVPGVYRSQQPGQPTGWIGYQWRNRLYAVVDKQTRIIMLAGVWTPWALGIDAIAQPPYLAQGGIGLGSHESEVVTTYGAPDVKYPGDGMALYVYNRSGVGFFINMNSGSSFFQRVSEIFVFRPGMYR